MMAEISAGRIPVYNNNIADLDIILNRILLYENEKKENVSWRWNALLATDAFDTTTTADKASDIYRNSSNVLNFKLLSTKKNEVMIKYSLEKQAQVSIEIYSITGKQIKTVFSGYQQADNYIIRLNTVSIASGTYLCIVKLNNNIFIVQKFLTSQ